LASQSILVHNKNGNIPIEENALKRDKLNPCIETKRAGNFNASRSIILN